MSCCLLVHAQSSTEFVDLSLAWGELSFSLLVFLGTDPGATQHSATGATQHFSLWEKQTSSSFPHPCHHDWAWHLPVTGHWVSAGSRGSDHFLLSLLRSLAQHSLQQLAHSQPEVTLSWYRPLLKI